MSNNKIALITGGTSGVGLSIVKDLIRQNYEVIFIGLNESKGKLLQDTLNIEYPGQATFVKLDLSNLIAVYDFSKDFIGRYEHLDLLANVAGVLLPSRQVNTQGQEKTFSIGYLSAFILSTQLAPLLSRTVNARIVNVAAKAKSVLNFKLDFNNLDFNKNYNGFTTSLATVHAKTVLTAILSEKLAESGIKVNSFDPGMVKSGLSRNMPLVFRVLFKVFSPFMSNSSTNGIYVCTSTKLGGKTGQLYVNQTPIHIYFENNYKILLWKYTLLCLQNLNIELHEDTQL